MGNITIVNKDGLEWKLHLGHMKGSELFYIRGLRDCFVANGIKKVGDSFTLEAIRGGANPILKISSKVNTNSFSFHVLNFCFGEISMLKRIVF